MPARDGGAIDEKWGAKSCEGDGRWGGGEGRTAFPLPLYNPRCW